MESRRYYGGGGYGGGGMGLPKPQKGVAMLLVINIAAFVIQQMWRPFTDTFSAVPADWWQVWRLITFQFLHADPMHLLFNMIGLYFLGMYLERAWGTVRFIRFYLTCGAIAGLSHYALMAMTGYTYVGLIGASGGVFAVIAACAILFPQIRLIVLFFPMPIRTAAVLFLAIAGLSLISGGAGSVVSHAAHFGGMVAGGLWVLAGPTLADIKVEAQQRAQDGAWQRKMEQQAKEQDEIDAILQKIQREGIDSLTPRERRTLKEATDKRRDRDRRINKM